MTTAQLKKRIDAEIKRKTALLTKYPKASLRYICLRQNITDLNVIKWNAPLILKLIKD